MDAAARHCASHNVPRYTSYPTTADFTPMVIAKEHAAWLGTKGLVAIRGNTVVVTEAGRPVVRVITATFDTYRGPGPLDAGPAKAAREGLAIVAQGRGGDESRFL